MDFGVEIDGSGSPIIFEGGMKRQHGHFGEI
jgi:hypothetical protein